MSDMDDDVLDVIPLIRLAESYSDVADVSVATAPPFDRDAWLQERRRGIGGSDVGALFLVDPYRSPLDVYLDKVEGKGDVEDSHHMKRGRRLEEIVAEEYLARHPEDTLLKPSGILTHPQHQWMIANPDRIITSPRHKGRGILEIKVPSRPHFESIKLKGIPARYGLQMQHYLAVTGYKWGVFAVFNADAWELVLTEVQAWSGDNLDTLVKVEQEFWEEHVVPQVPPVYTGAPRVELPKVEGILKTVRDREFARAVDSYEAASAYAKEAEALKASAHAAVIEAINSEPGVFENDTHRVYYTRVPGRKSFDKKALARINPLDPTKVGAILAETFAPDLSLQHALRRIAAEAPLHLPDFEKQGDDFMTMRVYPVKPEQETGE